MSDIVNDPRLDVVAIGNALVDVLAHAPDDDLDRLGLVKGSMELVDLGRSNAVYEGMGAGVEMSGGSAANTCVGVAALGGRVGYIGKVADDSFGETFRHDIRAAGVEEAHVSMVAAGGEPGAEVATGRCLILVTGDGERTMATHLGVAGALGPEDLEEGLLGRAQVVYLEGYLWDQPPAKKALRRAMEVAHGSDALVALTLSDPFCVERHRREFLELLHGEVDVLFANEEEVMMLFDAQSFDDAVAALVAPSPLSQGDRDAPRQIACRPGSRCGPSRRAAPARAALRAQARRAAPQAHPPPALRGSDPGGGGR